MPISGLARWMGVSLSQVASADACAWWPCRVPPPHPSPVPPPPKNKTKQTLLVFLFGQAFFIGVQIEVEDAEVLPFPTTRQTLQEMLLDEEEKDFWDDAELAPAQERATATPMPTVDDDEEDEGGVVEGGGESETKVGEVGVEVEVDAGEMKVTGSGVHNDVRTVAVAHPMEG